MIQEDLNYLSKATKDYIKNETYEEILTGENKDHSLQTIVAQKREVAVAARMTSRPLNMTQFKLKGGLCVRTGGVKKYSGKEIADIFVHSVRKFDESYYPLSGDWRNTGIKQLVIFVKDIDANRYFPYARFRITDIELCSDMSVQQLQKLTDITPVCNLHYKTVIKLSNVETSNLPLDYLGNNSALPIYERAFTGSSPNIVII